VKPRYIVVWSYDLTALMQLVNDRYGVGYRALGGVAVKGTMWLQAMELA
jgi:hypothetical protein